MCCSVKFVDECKNGTRWAVIGAGEVIPRDVRAVAVAVAGEVGACIVVDVGMRCNCIDSRKML